jgi:hypothetical protein
MYYIQLYPFIESIELLIQKGLHKRKRDFCKSVGHSRGETFFPFLMWEREAGVDKVTRNRDSFDPDRTIESILAGGAG